MSENKEHVTEILNENVEAEALSTTTYMQDVIRSFKKNKLAVIGLIIVMIIVIMVLAAPLLTKYDPMLDINLKEMLIRPFTNPDHILGTDDYGRDIWTRLIYGGRSSVLIGLTVALLSAAAGIFIGCIAGYFGGWVDSLLMRITDIMMSFPFLVIAIAIMAVLGNSQANVILALSIVSWPPFSRLTRGQVLAVKEQEYVESARVAGFSDMRIMMHHVLPNCWGPIIIELTLSVGGAILSAASLNFLGMGGDSAMPDWGIMLNQGRNYLQQAPYLTFIPGLAISITVLAINWIGDGLRDAFDPKLRK